MAKDYIGQIQQKKQDSSTTNYPSAGMDILSGNFKQVLPDLYQTLNLMGQNIQKSPRQAAMNMGMGAVGGENLAPEATKTIGSVADLLVPSRTGKAITTSTIKATKSGAGLDAKNIVSGMKDAVEKNFAPRGIQNAPKNIQDIFGTLVKHVTGVDLSPKTIAKLGENIPVTGKLSSEDLVNARQSIKNTYGYVQGSDNLAHNMANQVYNVLTQKAKNITPDLAKYDKAYSMQKTYYPALKKVGLGALGIGTIGEVGATLFGDLLKGLGQNNNQGQ